MISRCLVLLTLLLLSLSPGVAQSQGPDRAGLHVRLIFSDGRPCNLHAHVVLMNAASSAPVTDVYTADGGTADFTNLPSGTYHLLVSAEGVEETESDRIEINAGDGAQSVTVTLKRATESQATAKCTVSPTISAVALNIPEDARRQFEKARALMGKQDWGKAKSELLKAVELYPQYADAYNNLGVVYARLGDRTKERETLQTAIRLDGHFAPALVNLATMFIVDHELTQAEPLLNRAAAAEPENVQTLVLLAKVEYAQKHWEAAVATCHKVHSIRPGEEPFAHYLAAKALEQQKRPTDARAELHTFLDEEPAGPRADAIRKEVAELEASNR